MGDLCELHVAGIQQGGEGGSGGVFLMLFGWELLLSPLPLRPTGASSLAMIGRDTRRSWDGEVWCAYHGELVWVRGEYFSVIINVWEINILHLCVCVWGGTFCRPVLVPLGATSRGLA